MWKSEETKFSSKSLESTERMNGLCLEVLDILEEFYPLLRVEWALNALDWGTNVHYGHSSGRALQLFRCLNGIPNPTLLSAILQRMSSVVASTEIDEQKIAHELCLSAASFLNYIPPDRSVTQYSLLFWTGTILLESCHECEYLCGLDIVYKFLELVQGKNVKLLLSTIPKDMERGFDGILPLLGRGLASSLTESLSLKCMNFLLSEKRFLYGHTDRFIFVVLSNLPSLLLIYAKFRSDEHLVDEIDLLNIGRLLEQTSEYSGFSNLARIFSLYSSKKIPHYHDFIKLIVGVIKQEFADYGWEAVRFCMSLLTNKAYFYPKCYLLVLDLLLCDLPQSPMEMQEIDENWIRPLMNILNGDFYLEASTVLDRILSGRIKKNESDITMIVGGASNMYTFVKKSLDRDPNHHRQSQTGWPFSSNVCTGLVRTQLALVTKNIDLSLLGQSVQLQVGDNGTASLATQSSLIVVFTELHNFFSSTGVETPKAKRRPSTEANIHVTMVP